MTLPAVTKHLKVLENAGLIVRSSEAQWRPCSLRAVPLQDAAGWIEIYRQHWGQRLDRLEAYLQKVQRETQSAPVGKSVSMKSARRQSVRTQKVK